MAYSSRSPLFLILWTVLLCGREDRAEGKEINKSGGGEEAEDNDSGGGRRGGGGGGSGSDGLGGSGGRGGGGSDSGDRGGRGWVFHFLKGGCRRIHISERGGRVLRACEKKFDIQSMVSHLESADSDMQLWLIKKLREFFSDNLESADVYLLLKNIKQTNETSGSKDLKADMTFIHIISDYLSRYKLQPVFVIKHEVLQVLLDLLETDSVCEKVVEELG
ncbi:uncharacterized protein LOC132617514 [Lycium barbarum]|uniref:uncharacterized protein LOC132617514 n=1 Tax=Lycium barbarum TaxID=112863 RepID=UPI00293E34DE|nr:uncharacterized protein LOC132617514 [Lycium barbarum]